MIGDIIRKKFQVVCEECGMCFVGNIVMTILLEFHYNPSAEYKVILTQNWTIKFRTFQHVKDALAISYALTIMTSLHF